MLAKSVDKLFTLTSLKRPVSNKRRSIVGRGTGSDHGNKSGRGSDGQKARGGRNDNNPKTEGGQFRSYLRVNKRGFINPNADKNIIVVKTSVLDIVLAENSSDSDTVDLNMLKNFYKKKVNEFTKFKLLFDGVESLKKCKKVFIHSASKKAKEVCEVVIV